jgi:hypothetical protein
LEHLDSISPELPEYIDNSDDNENEEDDDNDDDEEKEEDDDNGDDDEDDDLSPVPIKSDEVDYTC